MATILFLIRNHWLAFGLFVSATAVALFFLAQLAMQMIWFNDPKHRDQQIAGWMTPRYVAMSYRLPRQMMRDVLELSPEQMGRRMTLQELATERGTSVEALSVMLMDAVEAHRQ